MSKSRLHFLKRGNRSSISTREVLERIVVRIEFCRLGIVSKKSIKGNPASRTLGLGLLDRLAMLATFLPALNREVYPKHYRAKGWKCCQKWSHCCLQSLWRAHNALLLQRHLSSPSRGGNFSAKKGKNDNPPLRWPSWTLRAFWSSVYIWPVSYTHLTLPTIYSV